MCNNCLNIIARFIRSLMYALGTWLVARSCLSVAAESTERVQPDWSKLTYSKMPDRVVDALRDLIVSKTATQATAWLFMVIARRMNRRSNRAELTLVDLMVASGLSRASILKHTAALESAGLLTVDRSTLTPTRNGVNVYHLAGLALSALLSPIIESQSNHFSPESTQQTPPVYSLDRTTTESLTEKQTPKTVVVEPQPSQPGESAQGSIEVAPPKDDSQKADDPGVGVLVAVGVELYKARELAARHNLARIQDVIDHSQSRSIQHPAAFVIRALDGNWRWDARQHKPKARTERTPDYERQEVVYGSVETASPDAAPVEATRDVEPVPEWAREAWSVALSQFRLQWNHEAYDRTLAGAQVVDVVGDSLVIQVQSPEARKLLETRLYGTVQRRVAEVLGWQPEVVNLVFQGVQHVR